MEINLRVIGAFWFGRAMCRFLFFCEVREGLERNLLGGEGGRKVGREDIYRVVGRRESLEVVNFVV